MSCPRCGEKTSGFFKMCGNCQRETRLLAEPKAPKRPIKEEDET